MENANSEKLKNLLNEKVSELYSHVGDLPPEKRPQIGRAINELKRVINEAL